MPKLNSKQTRMVEDAAEREFILLDPGLYLAALQKVEAKEGKNGPYWEWEFLLTEDENGDGLETNVTLWDNTSLSEKAAWKLKAHFAAFGVPPDTDTDDLLGEWIWVDVGHEVQSQGARAGKLRNTVIALQPVESDGE